LRIDLQLPQKKVACWVSTAYNLGGTRANNLQVHFIVPSILLNQHHILEESFHKHGLTGCAKLWHGNSKMVMPAADLAITKSGSVNLELALFNVSQATNHVTM
jgi:lipid A disaccharide synthetase